MRLRTNPDSLDNRSLHAYMHAAMAIGIHHGNPGEAAWATSRLLRAVEELQRRHEAGTWECVCQSCIDELWQWELDGKVNG